MEPSPSTLVQFLELGFAAAAALAGGFFIVLLIKYILESVVGQAKSLHGMILALDNRIKTMNNDVIRIDTLISQVVGIRPDLAMINSLAVEVLRLPGWCCIGRPQDRLILPDLFLPSGRVAAVHGPDLVHDFAFFNSVSHT